MRTRYICSILYVQGFRIVILYVQDSILYVHDSILYVQGSTFATLHVQDTTLYVQDNHIFREFFLASPRGDRQNMTSVDVRFWRRPIETIPYGLEELK